MSEAQDRARWEGTTDARIDSLEHQLSALWVICKETQTSVNEIKQKLATGEGIVLGTRATIAIIAASLGGLLGAAATWVFRKF